MNKCIALKFINRDSPVGRCGRKFACKLRTAKLFGIFAIPEMRVESSSMPEVLAVCTNCQAEKKRNKSEFDMHMHGVGKISLLKQNSPNVHYNNVSYTGRKISFHRKHKPRFQSILDQMPNPEKGNSSARMMLSRFNTVIFGKTTTLPFQFRLSS